jgi:hypothetical protein
LAGKYIGEEKEGNCERKRTEHKRKGHKKEKEGV